MTLKELSQLYYLNLEIKRDIEHLEELAAMATSLSSPNGSTPHRSGTSDKVGSYAAEIADTRTIIGAKRIQIQCELNKLMRYINGIDDSLTRQIFTARFVDGLSWRDVALVVGGNNTEESVKKICYRYIKKTKLVLNVPTICDII